MHVGIITILVSVAWRLHRRILTRWWLRLTYEEEEEGKEQEKRLRGIVVLKYASGSALARHWH